MDTISEQEFKRLCDDVYRDREEIYALLPSVSKREALFWMLLGSLVVLLSLPAEAQPEIAEGRSRDPYGEALIELLEKHGAPVFDPKIHLAELSAKLAAGL